MIYWEKRSDTMSELNIKIRKLQDNGSTFRATPESLYMGGVGSAKVDTLCFDVPEEWKGCAITLHVQRLSGTLPDPQLLDEKNRAVVDQRWTKEKQGLWMLMAVGADGYTAMTKPGRYTCYETIDRDSTTETITPSVYEQFVALVKKETAEANRAAKNAAASAEIAKNFESTITATGEQVQREITATADQTKQAIDEKAKGALASIPEDYTELSESVGQLKEDFEYFCAVRNLCGQEENVFYRVPDGLIHNGTLLTLSTGDGQNVPIYTYVEFFDKDYIKLAYAGIQPNTNVAHHTLGNDSDGTVYLKWRTSTTQPLQVEIGNKKTDYKPYKPSWFASYQDLLQSNEDIKTHIEESKKYEISISEDDIEVEIGSISGGKYYNDSGYCRAKKLFKVNKGDVFISGESNVIPSYVGHVYLYSSFDESSYMNDGFDFYKSQKHIIDKDCYVSFRVSKTQYSAISNDELNAFGELFTIVRNSALSSVDKLNDSVDKLNDIVIGDTSTLNIDYESINAQIDGKFTIVVQSDTHLCSFDTYKSTGEKIAKSDFDTFSKILRSVSKINYNVFANLGDIVQGCEFDSDFETRKSIDNIVETYSKYISRIIYVIGNHDDGNLFYYDNRYNDKKDVANVIYPFEQFNRITKYGLNNRNNKNYFYNDIDGVRIITLYQRDYIYQDSIPYIESFAISEEQLTWFENVALNTTNPIIVLTHAPLVNTLYENGGSGFSNILTSLDSFKENGGDVIGVFSGHTHKQDNAVINGINHIVFKNGYDFFEIVMVDKTTRTITCKPINKDLQERTFTY